MQPILRQLELAQREVQKMQPAIDELARSYLVARDMHVDSHAVPFPALSVLLPPRAEDPEKVALREENEELRGTLNDVLLTFAFGGPENEVEPEDFCEN